MAFLTKSIYMDEEETGTFEAFASDFDYLSFIRYQGSTDFLYGEMNIGANQMKVFKSFDSKRYKMEIEGYRTTDDYHRSQGGTSFY